MSEGPFSWLLAPMRPKVSGWAAVLTTLIAMAMMAVGPPGIIAFELAGSLDKSRAILQAWRHSGQVRAGINLGLDYMLVAAYGTTISLLCWLVVRQRAPGFLLRRTGVGLCWAALAAAAFDAVENIALIQILLGADREVWPVLAMCAAVLKFALLVICVLFVLAVWIGGLRRRRPGMP